MKKLAILLALLAGCGSPDAFRLEERWRPLKWIKANAAQSATRATTLGDTVSVQDTKAWLARHKGPLFVGVMLHEQLHAINQKRMGLAQFVVRYGTDKDFAREEEEAGWRVHYGYLHSQGVRLNPAGLAASLRTYKHLDGSHFWSRGEAAAFAQELAR